jgi:hypothetical protein
MKNLISKAAYAATSAVAVLAANILSVSPATADVQIGALACQPPYLAQAGNLRWHEHYLINPKDSMTTWVVCPIAFDGATIPFQFQIGAFGNTTNFGSQPNCIANVIDLRNQHIPTNNFLDNPGQKMIAQFRMATKNPANTLWSAWATITQDMVRAQMDSPPPTPVNPGADESWPDMWTITVHCQLKPGDALNVVSLWPTNPNP